MLQRGVRRPGQRCGWPTLTPAERRVAEHLSGRPAPEGALSSAAEIAEQLGTSDATVVRTAKALGYGGLADLRRALAAPDATPAARATAASDARGDATRRAAHGVHHPPPRPTWTCSPGWSHLRCSSRPSTSCRGAHASSGAAWVRRLISRATRQLLCRRIGHPSLAMVETGASFADELLALRSDDVVVVMAYGRLQSHVSVLLDHADTLECPVVLITDDLARTLGTRVASLLQCGTRRVRPLQQPRGNRLAGRSARARGREDARGTGGVDSRHAQRIARVARGADGSTPADRRPDTANVVTWLAGRVVAVVGNPNPGVADARGRRARGATGERARRHRRRAAGHRRRRLRAEPPAVG